MMTKRSIVIFDLGGVLIDWDPRHLYRRLFQDDEAEMERFLTEVCNPDWNKRQDAGRPFAEAEAALIEQFPEHEALIRAWRKGFQEMIPGALEEVVTILTELKERGVPLYALSNWSAETFAEMPARFPFLAWFHDIVVSGHERVIKPDPQIYRILLERTGIAPKSAVFIDDSPPNAAAAEALGMRGLVFTTATQLRADLATLELL
jgi:2-haloacid dehalogenase